MELYRFRQGSLPLLVSMPHPGTYVPPAIEARLTEVAKTVPDTDWHKPRLYDFLQDLDVSVIEATHSRRSEEHTSELQALMRNSYAVFCLKKKKNNTQNNACT